MALYAQQTSTSWLKTDDDTMVYLDTTSPAYAELQAWIAAGNVADPMPVELRPTQLRAGDFLARFTQAEQAGVQQMALANAQVALGLTMGLARGWIDLHGPLLLPWMNALVAGGAITAARRTEIMTP